MKLSINCFLYGIVLLCSSLALAEDTLFGDSDFIDISSGESSQAGDSMDEDDIDSEDAIEEELEEELEEDSQQPTEIIEIQLDTYEEPAAIDEDEDENENSNSNYSTPNTGFEVHFKEHWEKPNQKEQAQINRQILNADTLISKNIANEYELQILKAFSSGSEYAVQVSIPTELTKLNAFEKSLSSSTTAWIADFTHQFNQTVQCKPRHVLLEQLEKYLDPLLENQAMAAAFQQCAKQEIVLSQSLTQFHNSLQTILSQLNIDKLPTLPKQLINLNALSPESKDELIFLKETLSKDFLLVAAQEVNQHTPCSFAEQVFAPELNNMIQYLNDRQQLRLKNTIQRLHFESLSNQLESLLNKCHLK